MTAALGGTKKLLRRCKWALWKRLGGREIDAEANACLMRLRFTDGSARQIYFGEYETEETRLINRLARPGMIALDIGANLGYFTLQMARLAGPAGRVHAFEPNPEMFARLQDNVRLNPALDDGRIACHKQALGEADADAEFFCPVAGREGVGGLKDIQRAPVGKVIRVAVQPLDDFLAAQRVSRVDFVKMDIEGGELGVLRGASRMLAEQRPVILFEAYEDNTAHYNYRVFDILSYLEQRGYEVRQAGLSYNFIATPRGSTGARP
jgi:FkbM family methyltransferase